MKKKTQLQKFKYKHLSLRKKGKKVLVKKRSAKFVLIAKTKKTIWFTYKHIEIIRRIFYKKVTDEEGGFILSRIYPYDPFSKKPLQTRMGKGKGKNKGFFIAINNGQHLLDIFGLINNKKIKKLVQKVNYRLSPQINVNASKTFLSKYDYKSILLKKKIKRAKKKIWVYPKRTTKT